MGKEIFISVDIEASGPVPGIYSMLSFGAWIVGNVGERFYVELRPISEASIPAAMAVVGKRLEEFQRTGRDPAEAMSEFEGWVKRVSAGLKPVFVSFNATFDWAFMNWYFHAFHLENPFGIGGVDIKAFYMGMSGCAWEQTRSSRLPAKYRSKAQHTHNALADAIEQGEMFEKMARAAGVFK